MGHKKLLFSRICPEAPWTDMHQILYRAKVADVGDRLRGVVKFVEGVLKISGYH